MGDSTHWLDEQELTRLLERCGIDDDGRSEIRHITIGGERRWSFWDIQDWLDLQTARRWQRELGE